MSVLSFPTQVAHFSSLSILLIDLQAEYVSDGRAFVLPDVSSHLANCKRLLDFARQRRFPIIHFRRFTDGAFFNRETKFSRWIEGFEPKPNELFFEREKASCYGASSFENYLKSQRNPALMIAGFTAEFSCMATIIDAYHRDQSVFLLGDASPCTQIGERQPDQCQEFILQIISLYCDVISTDEAIGRLDNVDPAKMELLR
jgi:nicotinamidase-related amidase